MHLLLERMHFCLQEMRKAEKMEKHGNKSEFPGGLHPTDGYDKLVTRNLPIRRYQPETVTILAQQSYGGKCRIFVNPLTQIREGSLIGIPENFLAAPLHASVSGEVMDVREVLCQGRKMQACIIKAEGILQQFSGDYMEKIVPIDTFSREEIIEGIQNGGLTGMGGAGFPTYQKYKTGKSIDTLLINGAECEPFLTCDYRLMLEYGHALINGVQLLKKASGAEKAYICIEDDKPEALKELKVIVEGTKGMNVIEVKALFTKYPQGGERQLIQSVLHREVPIGGLPADAGVIVSNVGTAKAAADMLLGKKPLTRRIVTVTGKVKQPGNYLVPIGTSARELLTLCGGVTVEKNRIIAGGPMTGVCTASDWTGEDELFYVTKSTSGIVVLPDRPYRETPCMRCGGCEQVCPAGLVPYKIDVAMLEEDYDLCESLYAGECIACGCCSFICPAQRELTVRTIQARNMVKQRMRERVVKKL